LAAAGAFVVAENGARKGAPVLIEGEVGLGLEGGLARAAQQAASGAAAETVVARTTGKTKETLTGGPGVLKFNLNSKTDSTLIQSKS
jgi:hypothetical protein